LDRLERRHANDHSGVQNRPEQREFNVRKAVRQVNADVDEFVVDNMDMDDVDFVNMSMGQWKWFGQQWNCWYERDRYDDDFGQRGNLHVP